MCYSAKFGVMPCRDEPATLHHAEQITAFEYVVCTHVTQMKAGVESYP